MKCFLKYFLVLFVFNLNASSVQKNVDIATLEVKGKVTTSLVLVALSNICQEVAKISVTGEPRDKLEGTLNIVSNVLAVAAQAALKEEKDKDKKNIVVDEKTVKVMKETISVLSDWVEQNE